MCRQLNSFLCYSYTVRVEQIYGTNGRQEDMTTELERSESDLLTITVIDQYYPQYYVSIFPWSSLFQKRTVKCKSSRCRLRFFL